MRYIRIEEQKLPRGFEYIVVQFTGRPVHALLWFIWLWLSVAILIKLYQLNGQKDSMGLRLYFVLSVLSAGFFCFELLATLVRPAGRLWLFSVYKGNESIVASRSSRFAVILVPIVAALSIVVVFLGTPK